MQDIKKFFRMQKEMGLSIDRLHLHPYGFFFMCYDKNKWENARDAIVKSSIAVPKYCLNGPMSNDIEFTDDDLNNFDTDALPKEFNHPYIEGEKIKINKDTLTYDFQLDEDIECYMQFFIKCNKVFKTAGMGDTISGTGFIYHAPK